LIAHYNEADEEEEEEDDEEEENEEGESGDTVSDTIDGWPALTVSRQLTAGSAAKLKPRV
jgi:hypothetical protein